MTICSKNHRYQGLFEDLPTDQGGIGRHKCAGCAYDRGHDAGARRDEEIELSLETLPGSQAGAVRHKSTVAAFALGYYEGALSSY